MSWVDGQVVTDWAAEIAKRERAIDGYLNDTDPGRAADVRFPQRAESAAGLELVPRQPRRIQRRAVRALQDDSRSRSRPREPDAARHRPDLEARGGRAGGIGSAGDPVDLRSHRHRAEPVRLRRRRGAPAERTPVAASVRIRVREPALVRAAVGGRDDGLRRTAAGAARLSEHESADRQDANRRQGGELGARPAGLREPGRDGSRVLFVRGLPRRPRDGVGEDEVPSRHAEHRDRGAVLLEAADAHRRGAGRIRFRSRVDQSGEPRQHQAQYERGSSLVHGDAGQGAPAAGNAVRFVSLADRPREDSGPGARRRVPERHAGSHRRRREDALHLSRRRQEQRLQSAAPRRPRGPSRPDGCFRDRLRPRRDPHAPPRQQLSGIRAPGQPEQPDLLRVLEGERLAGRRSGHDRAGHGREGCRRTDLQEHSRVGPAGPGADRRQERQLGDRSLPRQLGRQSGRLVPHPGLGRLCDRRPAHGERAHSRAAQPVHRQSSAAAVSVRQRRSGAGARRQGAVQGQLRQRATLPATRRSTRPRSWAWTRTARW